MAFRYEGTVVRPYDFFGLAATRGEILGTDVITKFGRNGSVGTSFVPISIGGVYQTPTSAVSLEFVANLADALNGAGMHELTVQGLDANWLPQTVVTSAHATDGSNAVAISGTWTRVHRAYVSASGTYGTASAGSHVGDITIRVAGAGATYATIDSTDFPKGQTEIAAFTIPKGYSGYVGNIEITLNKTGSATCDAVFFSRPGADDVVSSYSGMRGQKVYSALQAPFSVPSRYPTGPYIGPCDIGFMAKSSTGTTSVSVDFDIILQKEDEPSAGEFG